MAESPSKEDSGVLPWPARCMVMFPTLVMECGNSESLRRLHEDRDWWFDNSPPGSRLEDVKVVITIKVFRLTCHLLIEQWHRHHGGEATQSVTISAKDPKHPHLTWEIGGLIGRSKEALLWSRSEMCFCGTLE